MEGHRHCGHGPGLNAMGVVFLRYDNMDKDDASVWGTPAGEKMAWFADSDSNIWSLTQSQWARAVALSCRRVRGHSSDVAIRVSQFASF